MLAKRCYQQLDEPVVVFMGLQFGEVVIVLGVGFGVAIAGFALFGMGGAGILGLFAALGASYGVAKLLRKLRKGVPAYPLTRLYRYRLLPAIFRPRYLVPLEGTAPRIRLSPMGGMDDRDVRSRRTYFGR